MGFKTWDDLDDEQVIMVEIASTLLQSRGTIPSTRIGERKSDLLFEYSDEERRWRDQALCLGLPQDIFFPQRGESMLPAYTVCRACPVRIECLQWAIETGDSLGIRGGHTPEERGKIRREVRQGASYEEASKPLDEKRYKKFLKSRFRSQVNLRVAAQNGNRNKDQT